MDIHALEKHNEILRAKCERHWASMESYKILFSDPGNSYFMPDSMKESQAKLISLLKMKVPQSCLTLCDHDPMDYTVHSILQARILKWVAFSFSRGSSQPRD